MAGREDEWWELMLDVMWHDIGRNKVWWICLVVVAAGVWIGWVARMMGAV